MTLSQLIESLSTDDYGKPYDKDMEVILVTSSLREFDILSVYENEGKLIIDIARR